jgi:hypothetical protein
LEQSYQTADRPDHRSGWVLVDATFIEAALRTLRGGVPNAPLGPRCFFCAGALERGACPSCDR